jgi:hypothetical protein
MCALSAVQLCCWLRHEVQAADLVLCRLPCSCFCSNPIVVTKSADSAAAPGRQRFNYLFYIDFVGALSDPNCQNALRHLQVGAGQQVLSTH